MISQVSEFLNYKLSSALHFLPQSFTQTGIAILDLIITNTVLIQPYYVHC